MSRFADPQDPRFRAINTSIGFDYRLASHDLDQSLAHARMLARVGILTDDEAGELASALNQVRAEIDENRFEVRPDDEDISGRQLVNTAAAWNSTSQSRAACFNDSGSSTSPILVSMCRFRSARVSLFGRTRTRTSHCSLSNSRTRFAPTMPVAPVTSAFTLEVNCSGGSALA